jgi:hypothetical protein
MNAAPFVQQEQGKTEAAPQLWIEVLMKDGKERGPAEPRAV